MGDICFRKSHIRAMAFVLLLLYLDLTSHSSFPFLCLSSLYIHLIFHLRRLCSFVVAREGGRASFLGREHKTPSPLGSGGGGVFDPGTHQWVGVQAYYY